MATLHEAVSLAIDEISKLKRENAIHIDFIQDIANHVLVSLDTQDLAVFQEKRSNFIKSINRNRGV